LLAECAESGAQLLLGHRRRVLQRQSLERGVGAQERLLEGGGEGAGSAAKGRKAGGGQGGTLGSGLENGFGSGLGGGAGGALGSRLGLLGPGARRWLDGGMAGNLAHRYLLLLGGLDVARGQLVVVLGCIVISRFTRFLRQGEVLGGQPSVIVPDLSEIGGHG